MGLAWFTTGKIIKLIKTINRTVVGRGSLSSLNEKKKGGKKIQTADSPKWKHT